MAEGSRTNKKVISQYRCYVPNHPTGRRQLRSHYTALRLPPDWFPIDTTIYFFFSLKLGLLRFYQKLPVHTSLMVSAWAVIKSGG